MANKTQFEYLGEWRTMEEINNYLREKNDDEEVINNVISDIMRFAKTRQSVEQ